MNPNLYWLAVALVIVVTVSRLIRLWTYDDFPPVVWLNGKVSDILDAVAPSYGALTFCPWCCGFWIALLVIGAGFGLDVYDWTGPESAFWVVGGALSSSYLGAMLMIRDGDTSNDEPHKTDSDAA